MLGLWALGSAALGTDGVARLDVGMSGAASTTVVASLADPDASLDPGPVAATGAAGALADADNQALSGAYGTGAAGSVTAALGIALIFSPVTGDGVLGLWTLGAAALGVDTPAVSPLIGVGCACSVGWETDTVGAGVSSMTAAGSVTASISESAGAAGAVSACAAGDLADSLLVPIDGVAAAGIASPFPLIASMGQVAAVCAAGSCSNDERFDAPAVFAAGSAGSVSVTSIPGISMVGVGATGLAGHVRNSSPSSAIALWGTPVPGGTVAMSFAGAAGISVTVGTGQTLAQVAGALAAAINGNRDLMAAGVSASAVANVLTIHQLQPATVASSLLMTGT